jgi:hypothetical protein
MDKDGIGAWDPFTALLSGDIKAYTMDPQHSQGYFQTLLQLNKGPGLKDSWSRERS